MLRSNSAHHDLASFDAPSAKQSEMRSEQTSPRCAPVTSSVGRYFGGSGAHNVAGARFAVPWMVRYPITQVPPMSHPSRCHDSRRKNDVRGVALSRSLDGPSPSRRTYRASLKPGSVVLELYISSMSMMLRDMARTIEGAAHAVKLLRMRFFASRKKAELS